jgi:putative membrane protein
MPDTPDALFSQSDRKRISAAIAEAEKATSGEIVPYVVPQSDRYREAVWRAAAVGGGLTLLLMGLTQSSLEFWPPIGPLGLSVVPLAVGAICALLAAFIPGLRKLLTGRQTLDYRVSQRAVEAFVSEEVFQTRDRSGILIFLSLLERKVVVLGDSGINAKVNKGEWEGVVRTIVDALHAGRPTDGMVRAIAQCGELLQRRGVEIRPDDTNELPDDLRTAGR